MIPDYIFQARELAPYLLISSSILIGAYWIRDGMQVKKKTTKIVKKKSSKLQWMQSKNEKRVPDWREE